MLISHDPISGITSYDTTGDGQADAYDTTGDSTTGIDTFLQVPDDVLLGKADEGDEKRHLLRSDCLRRKAQWEQGDRVVIHSLHSVDGQRLNGMHGTVMGLHSGTYIVQVAGLTGESDLRKIGQVNLRRVGALVSI